MANAIMTQEFAVTIAATIKQEIPVLEYVNKELSKLLVGGSGDVVSVLMPNFGKVTKGASFLANGATTVSTLGTITALAVQVDKCPVNVGITKVGASYDILEKTLKLFTKESQIKEPRLSNLARTINQEIFKCVQTASHSAIVGPIGFNELAEAVAYVEESRVGDEVAGMLSPLLNNTIAASGANKFANPTLGKELYKGLLGNFMGAEFFSSADAGSLRLGTKAAQEFAIEGDVATISDKDDTLTLSNLTFGGGNTLTFIPAGTPFVVGEGDATVAGSIVSPFTMSSVYGKDTQVLRAFIATVNPATIDEDNPDSPSSGSWPITGGSAVVGVAPIYLNQDVNNVVTPSVAAVPNTWYTSDEAQGATMPIICPLLAGAKYALGAVFASKAIAFASTALRAPAGGVDTSSTTLDGELNIRTTVSWDGKEGEDLWRVDSCYGMAPLYGAGAVACYGQIV